MTYCIDTNIFLRTLIAGETKQHRDCVEFLLLVKKGNIEAYTCSIVLAEIVWTLGSYYKFSKNEVIRAVQSVINLNGLKIVDNYNHSQALVLYHHYTIKYIDALIASTSLIIAKKDIIISYDKDFKKLPVLVSQPNDII